MQSPAQPFNTPRGLTLSRRIRRATSLLSRPTQWRLFLCVLLVNDIIMTGIGFLLAAWIRFNLQLPFFNLSAKPTVPTITVFVVAFVPLWCAIFAAQGLYQRRNLLGGTEEYAAAVRATTSGMLLIVVFGFLRPIFTPARGWVLLAWLFAIAFVIGSRFALRRVIYLLRRRGFFLSPTLIIGANDEACTLAEQLATWRTSGLFILGFVDDHAATGTRITGRFHTLGNCDDLDKLIQEHEVEELVLATSALTQEQILTIFKRYGVRPNLNLRLSSGLFEIISTGLEVKEVASVPLVRINHVRLTGVDWVLKSLLDIVGGLLLSMLVVPLVLLVALFIKFDSPGPIFYKRRVMGLNGRQFNAYKFRTMYTNGDEILAAYPQLEAELSQNHKLKDDPRITPIGRWLRKTSLDELPQLLNVLRREMSIVGPRMIAPEEIAMYDQWDINLLTVHPGITGLWQVSGRSDISYNERVHLDMRYIRNWSIWLDLHILFRTIPAVIKGHGAY